jgi:hypothetical protein
MLRGAGDFTEYEEGNFQRIVTDLVNALPVNSFRYMGSLLPGNAAVNMHPQQ